MAEYTPYQKKIIDRYYEQADNIGYQHFSELISEIYLAETKKKQDTLWKRVEQALAKVKIDASMVQHIMTKRDPKILAEIVAKLARG